MVIGQKSSDAKGMMHEGPCLNLIFMVKLANANFYNMGHSRFFEVFKVSWPKPKL